MEMSEQMLVNKTEYLTAGVHIGMKSCTPYMKQFVYRIRDDGLAVFNLQKVDKRIRIAADFLSGFRKIMVVSKKDAASRAIRAFGEAVGAKAVAGRFSPGTLTNPSYRGFYEPDVVFIIDPLVDEQAIREARKRRVPIVSLCDTFNISKDIDLCIPSNNNGKKSISLIMWLLAREILKKRGDIKKDEDFKLTLKDFGSE
jgi:small subunit ribosomal protein S2